MYVIRQAELNGRGGTNPWSIRQTAVYHGRRPDAHTNLPVTVKNTPSMFLIIAPTVNAEIRISKYLEESAINKQEMSPWNVHRLIISDSLLGWSDYIANLEARLREQTNLIICATDDAEEDSPLEHGITFDTRQELKVLEDFVLDLLMILSTKLETISSLRDQCQDHFKRLGKRMTTEEKASHQFILREFDEYVKDAEFYLRRAKDLNERIQSTVTLLSDFLSHEENRSMHKLTERSTKDAAAVKILTIITLVYLPTTIVANFFSTQFVQTSDSGHMSITKNWWILAAISIPLTAFTIVLWWAWVYFTEIKAATTSMTLRSSIPSRQISFRSFISSRTNTLGSSAAFRKKRREIDIETGMASHPIHTASPPLSFHDAAVGTWSTTATTVKVG
ncbi:hypothetical protein EAF04_004020 [Stromatinia cepivora]|nr:hypothetical protein EAF04_004020 [Stromatinia cepivora]